jgi:uncharacterized protein (TIGR00369 family)
MNDEIASSLVGKEAEIFARWGLGSAVDAAAGALPSHHDHCLGCGRANPHGHRLVARRDGDSAVVATHTFDSRHVGAPGVAHGGAVATVVDDLYGFALYLINELAVTRALTVEYLRPVVLGTTYQLRAQLDRREGRKLHLSATLVDPADRLTIRSEALFIVVDAEHFHRAGGQG